MTFKTSNPTTAGGSVGLGDATDWLADCTPRNTAEKSEVQGPSVALIEAANPVCDFDPAKVNGQAKSPQRHGPEDNPLGYDEPEAEPDPQPRKSNKKKQSTKPTQQGFPPNFHLSDGGLFWKDPEDSDKPLLFIASHFQVVATTRADTGNSWGLLLRWIDPDGRVHEWAMPRSMLAADAADVRRKLLDGGLNIAPSMKARNHLTSFLTGVKVEQRARAVSATGWYDKTFVLPDATIGEDNGERVILQTAGAPDHSYNVKGNLTSWQDQVAKYAVGNSRLVLAISTAFAAPLVWPCGQESGGLHFRGSSSIGKTTALHVAGSVWGGGDGGGFVRSWRATANGLEAVAAHHNDSLLCLDELSQLNGREAGEVAYMLANGSGKSRAMRDASLRKPAKWRLLFLSSGEIGLADKVAEDVRGRRLTAGQQVRVVDVPADTGSSYGLFEELHGFADAGSLAKHLMSAAHANYGHAGREFVTKIAPRVDEVTKEVKDFVSDFLDNDVPSGADGQVRRVAGRFALVAAAGEKSCGVGGSSLGGGRSRCRSQNMFLRLARSTWRARTSRG
jgi:uncharacterized protein (DUF927 family)